MLIADAERGMNAPRARMPSTVTQNPKTWRIQASLRGKNQLYAAAIDVRVINPRLMT
jgi:hypothetical protein